MFLVAPVLFIGFFSAAYSETVNFESHKTNEHLISLRDHDFVGEDQRLSALLAERMAVLQAPLNLSDLEDGDTTPAPSAPFLRDPSVIQPKPDYLQSNIRLPQQFNVSMDYAEYFNATEWLLDVSPSLLHGPGGPSTPGPGRTPSPVYAPDPKSNRDGRRQIYHNPSDLEYNRKIMEMMKQCIYNAQRKITEIEPLIHTYERDPRFRIAFIFNRLDEWIHDMRTVLKSTMKVRYYPRRVKRVIWYYEHMLRLNIDITYSVEHLIHLHGAYMKNLEALMPLGSRLKIQKMKREQRRLKKYHQNGLDPGRDRYGR